MARKDALLPSVLALALATAPAGAAPPPQQPGWPAAATHHAPVEVDVTGAALLGPDEAPVTLAAFMDLQCPYSAQVAPVLDRLVRSNGGKLRLAVLDFPLDFHPMAYPAAEAAHAAGDQGKYWEMYAALLANHRQLSDARIREIAEEVGLDMAAFDAARAGRAHRSRVGQQAARGRRLGVTGTPTLFLNGYRVAERDPRALQELIDDLAAGRTPRQQLPPLPPLEALDTLRDDDPVRGNPDAPVTLVEYSDFHCPYCARAQPMIRRIMAEYPDQVRVVYKQFPLYRTHPRAAMASHASLAAHAQGKFWEMHDRLFAAGPEVDEPAVEAIAEELGLDMERFRAAMADKSLGHRIGEDIALGRRAQVDRTPTLFVNNHRVTQPNMRTIRAMIERELRVGLGD